MTAAIGALTTATGMSGAQLAFSAFSAVSRIQAGRTQARGLAAQATMARVQAKQEALKYKEQGVQVLDNILRTKAAITARAGAGGIDPFSGSVAGLSKYALSRGVQELYTVQDNQLIALRGGIMQAEQYAKQAKAAMRGGLIGTGLRVAEVKLAPRLYPSDMAVD